MALKNVPFRSEVLAWNPDSLADYFKKVSLLLLGFWLVWHAFGGVARDWSGSLDRIRKVYKRAVDFPPTASYLTGSRQSTELCWQRVLSRKIGVAQVPNTHWLCIQCSMDCSRYHRS